MKKKAEGGGGASSSFEIEVYHEQVEAKVKVALLEQSIGHINQTLIRIEKRLDKVDDHLTEFRGELNGIRKEMKSEFNGFRKEVKSDFRWMLGLMFAFSSGLLGVMAHGFHWF